MTLAAGLITTPSLQELFRDKDTGLPLRSGTVEFFKDSAHTVHKTAYYQTGVPGNYTATALPNPCPLTGIGSFSDGSSNDIIPLWWPYEGAPTDNPVSSNVELYYIVVKSQSGVVQFTRSGWPYNFQTEEPPTSNLSYQDYVPNGQFLVHNTILTPSPGQNFDKITKLITDIAPGGWTFERDTNTAADFVDFDRFDTISTNPSSNPRYAVTLQTAIPGSDTFKGFRLKFPNVNTFASATDPFTICFTAIAYTVPVNLRLQVIFNFGTGGSPSPQATDIIQATITIPTSAYTKFAFPYVFGLNTGSTLGTNDDDYIKICWDVINPAATAPNFSMTDILIASGDVSAQYLATGYPEKTDQQFLSATLPAALPEYLGMDLYVPQVLTPSGMQPDLSQIGFIFASASEDVPIGYLPCDGSMYHYYNYSSDLIPYKRLGDVLWDDTFKFYYTPALGYLTAYFSNVSTNSLRVTTNYQATGPITNTVDVDTGFTFSTIHTTGVYGYEVFMTSSLTAHVRATAPNMTTVDLLPDEATASGNLTFTIDNYFLRSNTSITSMIGVYFEFQITITNPFSDPGAGNPAQYFTFATSGTQYYMWFTVDGNGDDPATHAPPPPPTPPPAGTGIRVDLRSDYAKPETMQIIREAFSGLQITRIDNITSGTSLGGKYFKIHSNDLGTESDFFVWYNTPGSTIPTVPGYFEVRVDILTSYTATQVRNATQEAINKAFYGTPDLRGTFLRGWNNGANYDPNALTRYSNNSHFFGDHVNTMQQTINLAHSHALISVVNNVNADVTIGTAAAGGSIQGVFGAELQYIGLGPSGRDLDNDINTPPYGAESRPVNTSVQYLIKY